jgi:hypothetical protein
MFNEMKIGIRLQRMYSSLFLQTFLISRILCAQCSRFGRGLDSFCKTYGLLLKELK